MKKVIVKNVANEGYFIVDVVRVERGRKVIRSYVLEVSEAIKILGEGAVNMIMKHPLVVMEIGDGIFKCMEDIGKYGGEIGICENYDLMWN